MLRTITDKHLISGLKTSLCTMLLVATSSAASAVPELYPHQAKYEMKLLSANQDTQVVAVSGKVKFEIENDCKGWVSSEDYLIEFNYNSGDSSVMFSHFESWEDYEGKLYSFEI